MRFSAHAPSVLAIALFAAVASSSSAQYHDPVLLAGGSRPIATPNTLWTFGVFRVDGNTNSITTFARPAYHSRFAMDFDNRRVLLAVQYSRNFTTFAGENGGLFRLDPATGSVATIMGGAGTPSSYTSVYDVAVDHNGDYICNVWVQGTSQTTGYQLLKVRRNGATSRLFRPPLTASGPQFTGVITRDIDTGRLLVGDTATWAHGQVFEVDTDTGTATTWSTGGARGWNSGFSMPQDHRTGHLQGPDGSEIFELRRGTSSRTTLASVWPWMQAATIDLSTAPRKRWMAVREDVGSGSTTVFRIDGQGTVTSTQVLSGLFQSRSLDFSEGRHTQTVRFAPQGWLILLSAPRFAGRAYAAALGYTGVRPGVPIPGGRRLMLNLDRLSLLTVNDLLRPVFHPGPGVLDANGSATLRLDLRRFGPRLGIPLWIAWVVLDPQAPGGIAYVPDTYVMRV